MANQTFRLQSDKTDRIFPPGANYVGGDRIRPNETVEVDLAIGAQDTAFDQSKYDVVVETAQKKPFKV